MKTYMKQGNSMFIVLTAVLVITVITLIFIALIFKNHLSLTLNNLRSDFYMIGRNALFSIERDLMGQDVNQLYENDVKKFIEKEIAYIWSLDSNLKNGSRIVESAEILEICLLKLGDIDNVTKKEINDLTVHNVIRVKLKPIAFRSIFQDRISFNIHEDIRIRKLKTSN